MTQKPRKPGVVIDNDFQWSPMGTNGFQYLFNHFQCCSIVLHCFPLFLFSIVCNRFHGFQLFAIVSIGFMIFYCFQLIFHWFSMIFNIVQFCYNIFSIVSMIFNMFQFVQMLTIRIFIIIAGAHHTSYKYNFWRAPQ